MLCENQFERRQRRGPRQWKQQKTEILQMRTPLKVSSFANTLNLLVDEIMHVPEKDILLNTFHKVSQKIFLGDASLLAGVWTLPLKFNYSKYCCLSPLSCE